MKVKNTSLLKNQSLCNGKWIDSISGKKITIKDPATQEKIGEIPNCGKSETIDAINAAENAFKVWRNSTPLERSNFLFKWANLIIENKEDLAYILSREQGKPLSEAIGEITIGADYLSWYAGEARRVYGDVIISPSNGKQPITIRQPLGVCAAITPWNFPSSMITRKVGAMIGAGCTAVLKPDHRTPYSALALGELAIQAGLPSGVLNIIIGEPEEIGLELCTNSKIKALSFTGSTRAGKILYEQSASTVKKLELELGGNAPFIIFADADISKAVVGAIASKFRNSGQTCICANRFIVERSILDKFLDSLQKSLDKMKVGIGTEKGTDLGPLISEDAVKRMQELLEDAVNKGAKVRYGGKAHSCGKQFFEPTILTGVNSSMRIFNEEIFGPIVSIIEFDSEEEAYEIANNTEYGLGGYVYTNDINKAWRASNAIETGILGVNEGLVTCCEAPFGGVKQSGFGREGSHYGLDAYLNIKYVLFGGFGK